MSKIELLCRILMLYIERKDFQSELSQQNKILQVFQKISYKVFCLEYSRII